MQIILRIFTFAFQFFKHSPSETSLEVSTKGGALFNLIVRQKEEVSR